MPRKSRVFWPVALCLLLADCASKRLVVEHLGPSTPHDVLGSALRFTLAYNQGTAFGFLPGPASRVAVRTRVLITGASFCPADDPGELTDSNSCAKGSRSWSDIIPTNVPWTDVTGRWCIPLCFMVLQASSNVLSDGKLVTGEVIKS